MLLAGPWAPGPGCCSAYGHFAFTPRSEAVIHSTHSPPPGKNGEVTDSTVTRGPSSQPDSHRLFLELISVS